ncbi:hypothetical protein B0J17DRAFT_773493 [Rhizoctonia solani]|nr:hypothetical protein B0J17DRAFT_773493 [Rhizoctonia solani]
MGPHVHQFMEFFYTTSQAPDRDETAPVIATLLTQVAEHIRTTNCHECLSYFTQERAFNILAGIGSAKPDRRAVITVVSTVVIGLVTARLRVNTEALPSLLKVLCYMCDYDFDHLYDIDAFLIGARFQLEQLPTIIGPSILFPIQKLIYRLNVWAGMWEDHHWSNYSQKITSLQNQVQHWIDPNNPGGILPPDADHWEPIMDATMIIIPSPDMPQSDSAPEDTLTEAGLSGWINYIPSPQGSIEDEFALESAPTASEEQSAD